MYVHTLRNFFNTKSTLTAVIVNLLMLLYVHAHIHRHVVHHVHVHVVKNGFLTRPQFRIYLVGFDVLQERVHLVLSHGYDCVTFKQ